MMLQSISRKSGTRLAVLILTRSYALPATINKLLADPPLVNSIVVATGHIKSVRSSKNAGFIDISDGSSHKELNVVCKNAVDFMAKTELKLGQSVSVCGEWIESPGSQPYELVFDTESPNHTFNVVGTVPELYPMQKKANLLTYLRSHPLVRHRTNTLASILRFRSNLEYNLYSFFNDQNFIKVNPPLITSTDCEGAGEQFTVSCPSDTATERFFGKNVLMTVSTQLHLEVLSQSLSRVWTLSPCFRAEKSDTSRHLSEFWMLEAEISHVTHIEQLTTFAEDMLRAVTRKLQDSIHDQHVQGGAQDLLKSRYKREEAELMQERWSMILLLQKWPVISYTDAIETVNRVMCKGRLKGRLQWGDSLLSVHEKWLAGDHYKSPIFITDYPQQQKPFYMPRTPHCDEAFPTVSCFDLILPEIGELIGGSLREHRYDELCAEIDRRGMNKADLEWYISTRQNGTVSHGGFGMGFERLVMFLTCIDNVRDIVPFPRTHQSCCC